MVFDPHKNRRSMNLHKVRGPYWYTNLQSNFL